MAEHDGVPAAAIAAAACVAVAALAGAWLGPVAALLAVPAGLAALRVQREIRERHRRLRVLTQQDALTGLGNRRFLAERLSYEITRHRRHERRLVLLAMDLDGFKGVNDRFGHHVGDEVLREVAAALVRAVRAQDTVVRLGGDEFCVLAPEASWPEAERLRDRLQRSVSGSMAGLQGLSVSVGYAIFPDEGTDAEQLLTHADAAAIDAKRRSRRRSDGVRRVA